VTSNSRLPSAPKYLLGVGGPCDGHRIAKDAGVACHHLKRGSTFIAATVHRRSCPYGWAAQSSVAFPVPWRSPWLLGASHARLSSLSDHRGQSHRQRASQDCCRKRQRCYPAISEIAQPPRYSVVGGSPTRDPPKGQVCCLTGIAEQPLLPPRAPSHFWIFCQEINA
jgi:hypothetical protein